MKPLSDRIPHEHGCSHYQWHDVGNLSASGDKCTCYVSEIKQMEQEIERYAEDFERGYAERSGLTVDETRALGLRPVRCHCGYEGCRGWYMASRDAPEDEDE